MTKLKHLAKEYKGVIVSLFFLFMLFYVGISQSLNESGNDVLLSAVLSLGVLLLDNFAQFILVFGVSVLALIELSTLVIFLTDKSTTRSWKTASTKLGKWCDENSGLTLTAVLVVFMTTVYFF